ncbi:tetratricopeptide repeat protein [Chondromyces crocatus]|uniref:tetratricopeptide repeat protein n=1 Tax=Chondromyces crocatus TaxID=52 RepID=UPI00147073AC|nr:PEGA domain-containing protein [Chondromyces crocatus]
MKLHRCVALVLVVLFTPAGAAAQPAPSAAGSGAEEPGAAKSDEAEGARAASLRSENRAPDPSKSAYDAARVLYEDGDYVGALVSFQRAYDLSGNANTLWNMALCEKNLRHYARAIRLLERYQVERGEQLTDEDRQGALYLITTMRAFVSTMKLIVNERDATIHVDDESVGVTPLNRPLLVDMGFRRIRVTKKGFLPFDERHQVVGGVVFDLKVKLEAEVHEGRLEVTAGANDLIAIDGRVVGQGRYAGTLQSGGHTLRVTGAGMQPYQSEVVIQDDKVRLIQVTLHPAARTGLPAWLLVAGGAALAAGVGFTAGYLLFQAGQADAPTQGNLPPYSIVIR